MTISKSSQLREVANKLIKEIKKEKTNRNIKVTESLRLQVASKFIKDESIEFTNDIDVLRQIHRDVLSRVDARIIKTSEFNAINAIWVNLTNKRLTQEI